MKYSQALKANWEGLINIAYREGPKQIARSWKRTKMDFQFFFREALELFISVFLYACLPIFLVTLPLTAMVRQAKANKREKSQ